MKSLTRLLPVLAAVLMVYSLPALAGEGTWGQKAESGSGTQKDECLLVAKNCGSESINARVERLEREIAKGPAVYSDEDLNHLKSELKEAYRIQKIYNNQFPPI